LKPELARDEPEVLSYIRDEKEESRGGFGRAASVKRIVRLVAGAREEG